MSANADLEVTQYFEVSGEAGTAGDGWYIVDYAVVHPTIVEGPFRWRQDAEERRDHLSSIGWQSGDCML